MKISIDRIDNYAAHPIGFTKMDSYAVHFNCAMFSGQARFVPAGEDPDAYLNHEIDVEIAHEWIDGLRASDETKHQVVPLAEPFSYHVRGEVKVSPHHSGVKEDAIVYILAGDADFMLSADDIGNATLSDGGIVEFDVHGLSLWDEAI